MVEKSYRSLLKAISWRALGTLDTMFISYIITGNFVMASSICGIELFTKTTLFFLHERAWNRINIGRIRSKEIDYQI